MKLEMTSVQKLAKVLKILVIIVFVCNLIALLAVPTLVTAKFEFDHGGGIWSALVAQAEHAADLLEYDLDDGLAYFLYPLFSVWNKPYTAVLTLFLWACGVCTAIILWQARKVLDTVVMNHPFSQINALCMMRAGICCLIISAVALIRVIWGFFFYKSLAPLVTYNGLFVPVFAMGFLLCMVMSALFRQAAELKEENDLTI